MPTIWCKTTEDYLEVTVETKWICNAGFFGYGFPTIRRDQNPSRSNTCLNNSPGRINIIVPDGCISYNETPLQPNHTLSYLKILGANGGSLDSRPNLDVTSGDTISINGMDIITYSGFTVSGRGNYTAIANVTEAFVPLIGATSVRTELFSNNNYCGTSNTMPNKEYQFFTETYTNGTVSEPEYTKVNFSKNELRLALLLTGNVLEKAKALLPILEIGFVTEVIKNDLTKINGVKFGTYYRVDNTPIFGIPPIPVGEEEGIFFPSFFEIFFTGLSRYNCVPIVNVICSDREFCPEGTCEVICGDEICCINPETGKVIKVLS